MKNPCLRALLLTVPMVLVAANAIAQTVPAVATDEPKAIRDLRIVPPPSPTASTAQEEANKLIVLQWHYEFFDLGHFRQASYKYMAADFQQNDPREPSGRDHYIHNFETNGYVAKPPAQRPPLLAVFAQGDLVMTVIPATWPKPAGQRPDQGEIHCNMFRLKNGRIEAMWVSGDGTAPATATATPPR